MAGVVELRHGDVGTGPALLFIHGHPFDRTMWQPQIEAFRDEYRVITPDLRGYGQSPTADEITTLDDHARDLARLLDRLGIESAVVCGLSMGGQIAMEFCAQFPQRVSGAVFAATFSTPDDEAGRDRRRAMADRLLRDGMSRYASEVLPKMMAPANIEALPAVAEHVRGMMEATRPAGAAASLRGRALRGDSTDVLARLEVPTLVVVGSDDAFTTIFDAEHMASALRHGKLVVISGSGHLPNLERSAQFNAAVREFLWVIRLQAGPIAAADGAGG